MLGRDEHGNGRGDPLVLLHGVATSRLIWRHVTAPLSGARRVIAVDVPGFGESSPAGAGFELSGVADALARQLELERFDLLGHSLGGALAVALAARHPGRVRKLVLVSPAGLAPRAQNVAAALGHAAQAAVALRRRVGGRLVEHAPARWAMFGSTVADPGRLSARTRG